jgi:AcrR family transcriptional regulator
MSNKGQETKRHIVTHALQMASVKGLGGLTIGRLASDLGLSKSGLFAHFRSKEALQLGVLEAARQGFVDEIIRPAVQQPRGEARVRALFDNWLAWSTSAERPGGCVFVNASSELDDRPGQLRDHLADMQGQWIGTLEKAAQIAVDVGDFRSDLVPHQFAFDLYSILLGRQLFGRLLRDPETLPMTRRAFEALMERSR